MFCPSREFNTDFWVRQPFVSPAATKLLPYRPHGCFCYRYHRQRIASSPILQTLSLLPVKSGWKGICATHLFNFKPLFVPLSGMLTRHLITNFEFTGICQFDGYLGMHVSGKKMAELNNPLQSKFLWQKCGSNRLVNRLRFTSRRAFSSRGLDCWQERDTHVDSSVGRNQVQVSSNRDVCTTWNQCVRIACHCSLLVRWIAAQ